MREDKNAAEKIPSFIHKISVNRGDPKLLQFATSLLPAKPISNKPASVAEVFKLPVSEHSEQTHSKGL